MAVFDPASECLISVDVETAGPSPDRYSLLSIGACVVTDPQQTFYIELQPLSCDVAPEAMAVHGLTLERLEEEGVPPPQAMQRFSDWVGQVVVPPQRPVFVAFNAPFDWMFVNDYFHRFLGHNPFGHSALDTKALFMGLARVPRAETSMTAFRRRYPQMLELTHHALDDALQQAELLRLILADFDTELNGGTHGD